MGISKQYSYLKQTPSKTPGMGNPAFPIGKDRGDMGNTGKDFHEQKKGSGDLL